MGFEVVDLFVHFCFYYSIISSDCFGVLRNEQSYTENNGISSTSLDIQMFLRRMPARLKKKKQTKKKTKKKQKTNKQTKKRNRHICSE